MRIVEGPFPLDGDLTFTPAGAQATDVRLHAHGRAPDRLRLLEPVLALATRREMRSQYRRLKALLEGDRT